MVDNFIKYFCDYETIMKSVMKKYILMNVETQYTTKIGTIYGNTQI